jgi:hypothetical protein
MFRSGSIFVIAPLALVALAAVPAAAQYYPAPPGYVGRAPFYRGMPEQEVVSMLHSLGFTPIGRPRREGRGWIVRAEDEDGVLVRVTVDAASGEVINSVEIGPRSYGMIQEPNDFDEPRYRGYPPPRGPRVIDRDDYDDELPPPPAVIPGQPRSGLAAPRDNRAVAKPEINRRAAVPTPKPRPTEISKTNVNDPVATGSVPPKKIDALPPVNPLE